MNVRRLAVIACAALSLSLSVQVTAQAQEDAIVANQGDKLVSEM